jgi:hypothetical protein
LVDHELAESCSEEASVVDRSIQVIAMYEVEDGLIKRVIFSKLHLESRPCLSDVFVTLTGLAFKLGAQDMYKKFSLISVALIASLALPALAGDDEHQNTAKIGSTLNKKAALDLDQIPASAMDAIKAIKPGFAAEEAEKEFKHGNVYLDVEGEVNGEEIEFDMLQTESGWKVVEVQRDLSWGQLPENVAEALRTDAPAFEPKRIIESVQFGTDITIYEFYAVDADGTESRKEVKVQKGVASVLDEEWTH